MLLLTASDCISGPGVYEQPKSDLETWLAWLQDVSAADPQHTARTRAAVGVETGAAMVARAAVAREEAVHSAAGPAAPG